MRIETRLAAFFRDIGECFLPVGAMKDEARAGV